MHGMLSAAVILVVFVLVAAAGAGSTGWLYRAASGPRERSRPPEETEPAVSASDMEGPALAQPAPAEPAGPVEPSAAEPSDGARIYVLDSSRRGSS